MPDRRETMAGYHARQKIEYPDNGYFTIPDYRRHDYSCGENGHFYCATEPNGECTGGADDDTVIKIPSEYEVCGTCNGRGSMVNPSIDSNGITQSEMEELGDEFREDYFSGVYDVTCSECGGKRVVLEARREILNDVQRAVLEAWEDAIAEEGREIHYRNMGYQF